MGSRPVLVRIRSHFGGSNSDHPFGDWDCCGDWDVHWGYGVTHSHVGFSPFFLAKGNQKVTTIDFFRLFHGQVRCDVLVSPIWCICFVRFGAYVVRWLHIPGDHLSFLSVPSQCAKTILRGQHSARLGSTTVPKPWWAFALDTRTVDHVNAGAPKAQLPSRQRPLKDSSDQLRK